MSCIEFNEKSTGVITVTFIDEDGNSVIPTSIKWTLTTANGTTVINSREQIVVAVLAATIDIALLTEDLAFLTGETVKEYITRVLTIEAVYVSDLGSALLLKDEVSFTIHNLKYIT